MGEPATYFLNRGKLTVADRKTQYDNLYNMRNQARYKALMYFSTAGAPPFSTREYQGLVIIPAFETLFLEHSKSVKITRQSLIQSLKITVPSKVMFSFHSNKLGKIYIK